MFNSNYNPEPEDSQFAVLLTEAINDVLFAFAHLQRKSKKEHLNCPAQYFYTVLADRIAKRTTRK